MNNINKHAALFERIFGEKYIKEPYKYEAHNFNRSIVGKQYCSKCGLIALNNKFTEWSINVGCNAEDHPNYKKERKKVK
jgi:hypothetical protein